MKIEITYKKDTFEKMKGGGHYHRRVKTLVIIAEQDDTPALNAIFFKDGWGFDSVATINEEN